jgi:Kef-type K+ transport system membrane component KefB
LIQTQHLKIAQSYRQTCAPDQSHLDLFEYILILSSVIYALAVAQILSGVARIAQSPVPVQHYLPHGIWIFNLFLFVFLIWWTTWEFRTVDWTFPQYAYLLIAPTLLFFVCSLLTPLNFEHGTVDIGAHSAGHA